MVRLYLVVMLFCVSSVLAADDTARKPRMEYLDNGIVRIGVDLSIGGSITYFADLKDGLNMVNSYDWGRQVQMSFYSGPVPFEPNGKKPFPHWSQLGWNPIQSGDHFSNAAKILKSTNDGKTLYIKCVPMQWPLDNEPGECTFEIWIELEGRAAHIRSRLNNARSDKTQYKGRSQELPAVYSNGPWWRLVTYTGADPFTNGELTEIPIKKKGPGIFPWSNFEATENWASLINKDGTGMAVWTPGAQHFLGGFAGKPGSGGTKDSHTGYLSPIHSEILDHDIVYDYEYYLIAGSIKQIREYVYDNKKTVDTGFIFSSDRCHWIYENASDTGWPIKDFWHVKLEKDNPRLISPNMCWKTGKDSIVEIKAAFNTGEDFAKVKFIPFGEKDESVGKVVRFKVINDSKMHTYRIKVPEGIGSGGVLQQLVVLPCTKGGDGQFLNILSVELK